MRTDRDCGCAGDFLFYASSALSPASSASRACCWSLRIDRAGGVRNQFGQAAAEGLLIGWLLAISCIAGLFLSFHFDLPSSTAIVCTFGVFRPGERRGGDSRRFRRSTQRAERE
jgi:hypothetical protein